MGSVTKECSKKWLHYLPIPNEVWAEDEDSKYVYEAGGYINVKVLENIPRLDYLNDIKRNNINNNILIVPGLHDGIMLLSYIINEIRGATGIKELLRRIRFR